MSDDLIDVTGSCYCGRVRYRAGGVTRRVTECHCTQCRKQSGHRHASTGTKTSAIEIEGADNITWFSASSEAARGFCATCGSHLFWKRQDEDYSSILAASVDQPSGLQVAKHIFVETKGDYYEIDDGLPQFEGYTDAVSSGDG